MSDFLSLNDNGTIDAAEGAFEVLGMKRLGAWVQYSIASEADRFVTFTRINSLTVQRLRVVTGETRDHFGAWLAQKANGRKGSVHVIRPGKGIPGRQNYIAKWTGTKHEFVIPSFREFGGEARFARSVDDNLVKMGNSFLHEMMRDKG